MSRPFDEVPDDALLALDEQLCFALHAASRVVTRAYAERLAAYGLTYPQYLVLMVLWEWDRVPPLRPTVKALGDRLDLDSGTLTPLLRRLVEKGFVTRERASKDEREVWVKVTKRGRALKRRVADVPRSMLAEAPIPIPEMIELRDRLKRLRAAIAEREAQTRDEEAI